MPRKKKVNIVVDENDNIIYEHGTKKTKEELREALKKGYYDEEFGPELYAKDLKVSGLTREAIEEEEKIPEYQKESSQHTEHPVEKFHNLQPGGLATALSVASFISPFTAPITLPLAAYSYFEDKLKSLDEVKSQDQATQLATDHIRERVKKPQPLYG